MLTVTDDEGTNWEIVYVVTQTAAEGPEYIQFRQVGETEWTRLPGWALVSKAIMEHFHGPVIGSSKTCQHCGNPVE